MIKEQPRFLSAVLLFFRERPYMVNWQEIASLLHQISVFSLANPCQNKENKCFFVKKGIGVNCYSV